MKIKGSAHFKQLTPLQGRTLDFLRRTGKYIGEITKPDQASKPESHFPSRTATRAKKQEATRPAGTTVELAGAKVVSLEYVESKAVKPLISTVSEKLLRERRRPAVHKPKPSSYPLKTFLLEPGDAQVFKGYVINKYARPKGLIPVVRSKEDGDSLPLQSLQMQQFLDRFESKREPDLPPRTRKGFNGWKLTRAYYPQTVEEDSREAGVNMLDMTVPEEYYVQYLPWKHTIDDFA